MKAYYKTIHFRSKKSFVPSKWVTFGFLPKQWLIGLRKSQGQIIIYVLCFEIDFVYYLPF